MSFLVVMIVGLGIAGVFVALRGRFGRNLPGGEFLCDRCKYSNPRDCNRPERPNARKCPDYRRR